MTSRNTHKAGFTFIEMMAALVLTGLVGAAFVMALAFGTDQYVTSSQIAELSQKSRLALARLNAELAEIQGLDLANQGQIDESHFYYIDHDGDAGSIGLTGSDVVMNGQFILVDGVATYTDDQALFTYLNGTGNTWVPADGFDDLYEIAIELRLSNPGGTISVFTHSVNPRKSLVPNAPHME